jgi:hypothetical protein
MIGGCDFSKLETGFDIYVNVYHIVDFVDI